MWNEKATPPAYLLAGPLKTTFDDGAAMVKALSDIYEGAVKPTLPTTEVTNHKFNWTDPGSGVTVEGFVNVDDKGKVTLQSIYILASSF
jgi:hypothetical protein